MEGKEAMNAWRAVKAAACRMLSVLDDWLFPERVLCLCCSNALGEDEVDGLCPACARALEQLGEKQEKREALTPETELAEGLSFLHAAYPYEGQAKKLIRLLKFRSIRAAALPLARGMAYLPTGEEELIVPVPTDEGRRRRRGYNQATLLAAHLSQALGMPMCEALIRTKSSPPQTGLSLEQRRENLVGIMAAHETVRGKRILLVDDVYTTGSTAAEAARALHAAGAKSVGMLAAARAGLHHEDDRETLFTKNG